MKFKDWNVENFRKKQTSEFWWPTNNVKKFLKKSMLHIPTVYIYTLLNAQNRSIARWTMPSSPKMHCSLRPLPGTPTSAAWRRRSLRCAKRLRRSNSSSRRRRAAARRRRGNARWRTRWSGSAVWWSRRRRRRRKRRKLLVLFNSEWMNERTKRWLPRWSGF